MYSIVIPVYNSENSLKELYERIKTVFDKVLNESFEMILVNDSSRDKSWSVMQELHKADRRVKVINLANNFGQHAALLCGLKYCTGDYVIMMDDDLQHPPEEIPKLISALKENPDVDVVFGSYKAKKHSLYRNIGSFVTSIVGRMVTKRNNDLKVTSFRVMRAELAKSLLTVNIQQPRVGSLIMHYTGNVMAIEVEHHQRAYGKSGYGFKRLYKDFASIIIGNSVLPLKLISSFGMIVSLISMLMAIYYFIRHFVHRVSAVGWTSLIVAITFFSGVILFTLGIIGEYLIRILQEAKKMPIYIERDVLL